MKNLARGTVLFLSLFMLIFVPQSSFCAPNGVQTRVDFPQFLRVLVKKAENTESPSAEKIVALESSLSRWSKDDKLLANLILAEWYWKYYLENRWRILGRTTVRDAINQDFREWSPSDFVAKVERAFASILSEHDFLKKGPVSRWKSVLDPLPAREVPRPTLYDFVAFRALEFYTEAARILPPQVDAVVFDRNSLEFADSQAFLKADFEHLSKSDFRVRALLLYRNVMQFHAKDINSTAFLDADLLRLRFVDENATPQQRQDLYEMRLKSIVKKHPSTATVGLARVQLARLAVQDKKYLEAEALLSGISTKFPLTQAALEATEILKQIRSKELDVSLVSSIVPVKKASESVIVTFRNIERVFVKIFPIDWNAKSFSGEEFSKFISTAAAKSFVFELPGVKDRVQKSIAMPLPPLEVGNYMLVVSSKSGFERKDNVVKSLRFSSSNLAIVLDQRLSGTFGRVLNAVTGEPEASARVSLWRAKSSGILSKHSDIAVNQDGAFEYHNEKGTSSNVFLAEKNGDRAVAGREMYSYGSQPRAVSVDKRVVFYTDRAVYRPGQSIKFKAVLFERETPQHEFRPSVASRVTIQLIDANSQVVDSLVRVSNSYGSADGSFVLPGGRLLGSYGLRVSEGVSETQSFNVEEYKRPKYFAILNEPVQRAVLGKKVSLSGLAQTYSGVPVSDARVNFSVRRIVYVPWWERIRFSNDILFVDTSEVEIAKGSSRTDSTGQFDVNFVATPDKMHENSAGAVFSFSIEASIVDATGETQIASRVVRLGVADSEAQLRSLGSLENPTPVQVSLKSNAGIDLKIVSADFKIFRLQEPKGSLNSSVSDWRKWKNSELVFERKISNAEAGSKDTLIDFKLEPGAYRSEVLTSDAFGTPVRAELPFTVLNPSQKKFPIRLAHYLEFDGENGLSTCAVGEVFKAVWGTGYDSGSAFVEVIRNGNVLRSFYTPEKSTQSFIAIPVVEDFRGGFYVRVSFLREHKYYSQTQFVNVPWSNKELVVKQQVFRSSLQPGQKEKWSFQITSSSADKSLAEVAATLYDASLDAIVPHAWRSLLDIWPRDYLVSNPQDPFLARNIDTQYYADGFVWLNTRSSSEARYPRFAEFVGINSRQFAAKLGHSPLMLESMSDGMDSGVANHSSSLRDDADERSQSSSSLSSLAIPQERVVRKNLSELAFFFPNLQTDSAGGITIDFVIPDALTTWKFFMMAHDTKMRSGFFSGSVVTSKSLMIEPSIPRFLRSGDVAEVVARLSNNTTNVQSGEAQLRILDAESRKDIGNQFSVIAAKSFELQAKANSTIRWKLVVPANFVRPVIIEMSAKTPVFSDGEENILPILSNQVFLTESKAFSLRSKGTHRIEFDALASSASKNHLRNFGVTLEYTANAEFLAAQSLTTLLESNTDCIEQVFNKFFSNALGSVIVAKNPAWEKVFAEWNLASSKQLLSPLENGESLKNSTVLEMPWLVEAKSESLSRRRMGHLFDSSYMKKSSRESLEKIFSLQLSSGAWSWFPGGSPDAFITMYILFGIGKLTEVSTEISSLLKEKHFANKRAEALRWVDSEMSRRLALEDKKKEAIDGNFLSFGAEYLYMRSFYRTTDSEKSFASALQQLRTRVEKKSETLPLLNQAHLAFALLRSSRADVAKKMAASIKSRALRSTEMGAWYGAYAKNNGWWYDAPIETQAAIIELFSAMGNDAPFVEDLKVWLLQQKRTRSWHSSKATADAVAAIFGVQKATAGDFEADLLTWGSGSSAASVSTDSNEKVLGYVLQKKTEVDVIPSHGVLQVKKSSNKLSFGAIHWQYFTPVEKIKAAASGLSLRREFVKIEDSTDLLLVGELSKKASIGDLFRVRLVVDAERDFEYLHLKDFRPSGFEPVVSTSGYKSRAGVYYYETQRDSSASFFVDYLPKGKHIFEYSLRAHYAGEFSGGFAEIQSLYAPEFGARSESFGTFLIK